MNSLLFNFNTFLNEIPEFPNSAPTTDPAGLAPGNELIFPGLADGVNFNVPQLTHLNQYTLQDTFTWSTGKHTFISAVNISIRARRARSTCSAAAA